ncbi:GyrI-like domain-containing protein [Roseivirga pacifica]|uniref:GyrI-like domain-containing protein n=1 Tax=Roseivirga pacifica TaxID=1267423 RepID=UPI0020942131|nr:GyrI-like domain-containing protein [Roseivirga pacifica]MCO6359723.1 hypothetical protein [Roseivirga pacifica]MCO6367093.1 hypothetical protein [Roseivirga pacifica]MCO6370375.1 hypothetical protein [Roseivirga pacifica]MCO6374750.1 hypothetical protein [Roseivirga pacifica]MCO6380008.1 hypothetical protein [Roseivirga pacifica]
MLTIAKLDLAKAYPEYYKATQKPQLVNFEPYHYLTCQGQCAPEDAYFLGVIEAMYPLAYGIKFLCKTQELDFVVPKMEAFWWVEGDLPYDETPREEWHWKILFRMPDFVCKSEFEQVVAKLKSEGKWNSQFDIAFEEIHEGLSAQILHIGSYEEEEASLNTLHQFIQREGFEIAGKHHEIYLNDPRKTETGKLKTILRYAVK